MRVGPTALMPETLRLRRDPLSVSAASPTLVTLVHRLSDATCRGATSALEQLSRHCEPGAHLPQGARLASQEAHVYQINVTKH